MPSAIQVNFRVGGLSEVANAFRSVEQNCARLEQASSRRAKSTISDAGKSADAETKGAQRAALESTKAKERAEKEANKIRANGVKDALKTFDNELKAFTKSEGLKTKEAEKAANYSAMVQR